MPRMPHQLRRIKTFVLAALAVAALAGATAAVVMASQSSARSGHAPFAAHAGRHHHRRGGATLRAAATYLGLSASTLRSELASGKSLGQIAAATPGKSEAGLVQALEAAARERLASANANLSARVKAAVEHVRGPGLLQSAAAYLGVSVSALRTELRGGKTLAQVAGATAGKSEAGLIEALVSARKARLAAEVKSGLSQTRAQKIEAQLRTRVERAVRRAWGRHGARTHAFRRHGGATGATGTTGAPPFTG